MSISGDFAFNAHKRAHKIGDMRGLCATRISARIIRAPHALNHTAFGKRGCAPYHARYISIEHIETDTQICLLMTKSFGKFLKERRLAQNFSLREFARKVGLQPSNYCNIEADVLPPPPVNTLDRIAGALGLRHGTEEFEAFHDLAAKGRDEIPADVTRIVKANELIPAMLRTVEYEKVTKNQLRGIIEDLKSGRFKKAQPDR
jgi:transcriptional regulator with XRE-family HTH domain